MKFSLNLLRLEKTDLIGTYCDVAKNQRLGVTGIWHQEQYQGVSMAIVMAIYTVGL